MSDKERKRDLGLVAICSGIAILRTGSEVDKTAGKEVVVIGSSRGVVLIQCCAVVFRVAKS